MLSALHAEPCVASCLERRCVIFYVSSVGREAGGRGNVETLGAGRGGLKGEMRGGTVTVSAVMSYQGQCFVLHCETLHAMAALDTSFQQRM